MTQQRVIDNVSITAEAETPIAAEPPLGDDLVRVRVGDPGQGSVTVWISRLAAPRFIAAIATAMQMDPESPMLPVREEPAAEQAAIHAERLDVFRSAITQIRLAGLQLIDADLFGASDEVGRCIFALETQFVLFAQTDEDQRASSDGSATATPDEESAKGSALSVLLGRRRGGRRGVGLNIVPGRVKQARDEAGLTMRQLAGDRITAAAICLIEKGRARPSFDTLEHIARQTAKPIHFFTSYTA